MRRSHPSSLDPKALAGISFDVCSIASTETASTVAGRGRGRGGLRKRRGGASPTAEDDNSFGLYSDPLSSMFSPTSYTGGSSSLLGNRKMPTSHTLKGAMTMPPPDARRSHGTLIGSKQGTHARTASAHGVQSVRVEISPTGSPNSPIPPSVTSNIKAPTINAFRRCLMIRGGGGGGGGATTARLTPSPPPQPFSDQNNSIFLVNGQSAQFQGDDHYPQLEVTVTDDSVEVAVGGNPNDYACDFPEGAEIEETHIFLFDNDANDDIALTVSSSRQMHVGGKERSTKKALGCKAVVPYAKAPTRGDNQQSGAAALATSSRRQRRVCRSRYDIEEDDNECDGSAAIYYVQVGHSALTPRDCPDDVVTVPQMPLLPSSIATAVIDEELAVLEELML